MTERDRWREDRIRQLLRRGGVGGREGDTYKHYVYGKEAPRVSWRSGTDCLLVSNVMQRSIVQIRRGPVTGQHVPMQNVPG